MQHSWLPAPGRARMARFVRAFLFLLLSLAVAAPAMAQRTLQVFGTLIPGHAMMTARDGVHGMDAGGPTANGSAPINGAVGTLPLGYAWQNSGLGVCGFSAASTSAYGSLCMGFDSSGNGLLQYTGIGTLSCEVNGATVPCAGQINGAAIVADRAALAITPTANYASITRLDYANGHGAPAQLYVPQTGACAANDYPGTSLAQVNDGGYCVDTSGGNSWRAQVSQEMDARQFGMVTTVVDNHAALQAALDAGFKAGFAVSIGGNGNYLSTQSVYYYPGSRIIWPAIPAPLAGNGGSCLQKNFVGAAFLPASVPGGTFPVYQSHTWWGGSLTHVSFERPCIDLMYKAGTGIEMSAVQASKIISPNIFNIATEDEPGVQTAVFSGSLVAGVLTVSGMSSGELRPGDVLAGGSVPDGTFVTGVGSNTFGNTGTYTVSSTATATATSANRPGTWPITNDQGNGYLPNGGIVLGGGGTVSNVSNVEISGGIVGNANTYNYDTPYDWTGCRNMGAAGIVYTSVRQLGRHGTYLPPNINYVDNVSLLCTKTGFRNDYASDDQVGHGTDTSWSGRFGWQYGEYGYLTASLAGTVSGGGGDTVCVDMAAATLGNSPKNAICYTTVGGDDLVSSARGFAKVVNGDADFRAYGITAIVPDGTTDVVLYFGEIEVGSATLATGGSGCTDGLHTFTLSGGRYGVQATVTGTVSSNELSGALTVTNAGSYFDLPPDNAFMTGAGCSVMPTMKTVPQAHALNPKLYGTGGLDFSPSHPAGNQDLTNDQNEVPRYGAIFVGVGVGKVLVRMPGFHVAAVPVPGIMAAHGGYSGAQSISVEYDSTGSSVGTYKTTDFTAKCLEDPQPYRVSTSGGPVTVTLDGSAPWGTACQFVDYKGSWGTTPMTIAAPAATWGTITVLGRASNSFSQPWGNLSLLNDQGTWDGAINAGDVTYAYTPTITCNNSHAVSGYTTQKATWTQIGAVIYGTIDILASGAGTCVSGTDTVTVQLPATPGLSLQVQAGSGFDVTNTQPIGVKMSNALGASALLKTAAGGEVDPAHEFAVNFMIFQR